MIKRLPPSFLRSMGSGVVIFLLVAGLLAFLWVPTTAHAVSPIVITVLRHDVASCCAGTFTSMSFTPVNPGDVLAVVISGLGCPGAGPPSGSNCNAAVEFGFATLTDSQGDSYVKQNAIAVRSDIFGASTNCWNTAYVYECFAEIWTGVAANTVSTTLAATWNMPECTSCGGYLEVLDVSNASPTANPQTGKIAAYGTVATAINTNPATLPLPPVGSYAAIGGYDTGGSGSCSGNAGWTVQSFGSGAPAGALTSTNTGSNAANFNMGCPSQTGSTQWVEVGIVLTASQAGIVQTQEVGFCETQTPQEGATHDLTMTNSTIYMYSSNALGQQIVNTVQTEVESVTGSGSHTLQFLIYGGTAQFVGAQAPLTLLYSQSFVLAPGTVNQTLTVQVVVPLNAATQTPLPFNAYAVGLVGDNKIKIDGSGLSGVTTQSGNPSTAAQPLSFTSLGSTTASTLALCALSSYQSVLSFTTVSTTQATTTTTVNTSPSINNSFALDNMLLAIIVILGPALLLAGVTRQLWGGILGALLGAVVGVYAGFLPFWAIAVIVLVCLVALFFGRRDSI